MTIDILDDSSRQNDGVSLYPDGCEGRYLYSSLTVRYVAPLSLYPRIVTSTVHPAPDQIFDPPLHPSIKLLRGSAAIHATQKYCSACSSHLFSLFSFAIVKLTLTLQTNSFSQFTNSLFSTSRHHSRSMAASSTLRQYRTIAYIVAALVGMWLLLKLWHGVGGGSGGGLDPGAVGREGSGVEY